MYNSDPRPENNSLHAFARAVKLSHRLHSKVSQDILINPQLDGREVENPLQSEAHFFHFLVFVATRKLFCRIIVANKSFSLQKRPLFVLFALVEEAPPSWIHNVSEYGCAMQNKGITLKEIASIAMDRENNHTANKNKQSKYGKLYFIKHSSEYLSI